MLQKLIIAGLATLMTTSFAFAQNCTCATQNSNLAASVQVKGTERVDRGELNTLLTKWKAKPREAAEKMISKYGAPHEATPTRMVWFNSGPWKYTILTNEEIPHDFPMPHSDMLRQVIDYKVPDRKFNDVLSYDGSIIIDRTPGEMSARCDKEEMNFLAINLANDVATGKRSVSQARDFYAKTAMAFMKGNLNSEQKSYTTGFTFQVSKGNTSFPDKPAKTGG